MAFPMTHDSRISFFPYTSVSIRFMPSLLSQHATPCATIDIMQLQRIAYSH